MNKNKTLFFRFAAIVCIGLIFNGGGVNSLFAQGGGSQPPPTCEIVNTCNPDLDCRQVFDIYADLTGENLLDIEPCRNRKFAITDIFGGGFGPCTFVGEYQTLYAWMPPLGDDESTCLVSGYSDLANYTDTELELMSFPFGKNTQRSIAATSFTGTNQRVLTINENLNPIVKRRFYALSSSWFTISNPLSYSEEEEDNLTSTPNDEPTSRRTIVPHSVIKHRKYVLCNNEPVSFIDVVIDNTRGRAKFYPFKNCNEIIDPSCTSAEDEHDISIIPFIDINTTDGNPPSGGFNYLNYFPIEEAPECEAFSCLSWDGTSSTPPLCTYMHPPPYSLIGVHLRNGASPYLPLGYVSPNPDGTNLQQQPGIEHTYIVDKNFDIAQINPEERIFYNPSEVFIEADNLIFPSGYSFVTARGLPPTLDDIAATPCDQKNNIDQRYMPVESDQPNNTYTLSTGTTISVKPSVYILEPGSKLTIQPCVHLYDMTIIVKPGARLIYYPNLLYGNFDPANDIIFDNANPSTTVSTIPYVGRCNDCRCEQQFDIYNGLTIDENTTWENQFKVVHGQIKVLPGVTLSIKNSELQFADTKITGVPTGITVLPGGRLNIIDAKLTVLSCHDMWDGIRIQGDHLIQAPNALRAYIYTENSVIEFARSAASSFNVLNPSVGLPIASIGGNIYAVNTTFRNNHVSFGHIEFVSAGGETNIFRGCTFEQTKLLKDTELSPSGYHKSHIILYNSQNTVFEDCIFKGLPLALYDDIEASYGILSYLSRVNVRNCQPDYVLPYIPCANSESRFENLRKGIGAHGTGSFFHKLNVQNTNFENCSVGISSDGNFGDYIVNNTFNCMNTDLELMSSEAVTVASNRFSKVTNSDRPSLVADNTDAGGGNIFQNDFSLIDISLEMTRGIEFYQDNHALSVICNTFRDFSAPPEIVVVPAAPWMVFGELGNQGSACGSGLTAGNLFYDAAPSEVDYHIWVSSTFIPPFTYFANEQQPLTVPTSNSGSPMIIDPCTGIFFDPNECPKLEEGDFIGMITEGKSPQYLANEVLAMSVDEAEQIQFTNEVLHNYFETEQPDSILFGFLDALNTIYAKRLLMQTHTTVKGSVAQATAGLSSLAATQTLKPDYEDLFELLHSIKAENRSLQELRVQQAEALDLIAQTNSTAGIYAQSILAFQQEKTWFRDYTITTSGKTKMRSATVSAICYPNPANNHLTLLNWENILRFNLYNINGALALSVNDITPDINISKQIKGLYIVEAVYKSGEIKRQKLLITR
ncbi:MAG: T9SS type A sorting domain-containing protein [Sphingobacteriales bacterium]|nr:MAG: T9SS type A sorting domain-containing protein [Sphingobacteriales bacterium]